MDKKKFKKYIDDNQPKAFWELDFSTLLGKTENDYTMTQVFNRLTGFLPNTMSFDEFNSDEFFKELEKDLKIGRDRILRADFFTPHQNLSETHVKIVVLSDELLMLIRPTQYSMVLYYAHTIDMRAIEYLKELSKKFTIPELIETNMYLVTEDMNGLKGHKVTAPELKILDIEKSYNDDFLPISNLIIQKLQTEKKGVVLLHGESGSGKTFFIRHLMSRVKKKFIVIQSDYAYALGTKEFMNFLLQYKNAVLIIEDAENAIKPRTENGISAAANLLNLSDGLLSDALNIQVIITFNTELAKIDAALTRKGRLLCRYLFGKLIREKAQVLSDSLGFKTTITNDMTLAEIYNQQELNFTEQPINQIGFKK